MSTRRAGNATSTPDTDEATIWFAPVATATAGGMPMKNRSGVIRNPPPTPNMPDRNADDPAHPENAGRR